MSAEAGIQMQQVIKPDEALRRAIQAPLSAFNESLAGSSGHELLAFSLTNPEGAVCGGYWGATAYGWLYTQLLVVPETQRSQGLGRQLMQAAETEARRRGCRHAWVDTIFGAQGFYERLGYEVFGSLPDHPPGFSRSFLKKDLGP
jgi:GNAT superfamily N-acetyltransferase